jgi:hypothetical protein
VLNQNAHLPLRHAVALLIHDAIAASGLQTQMELHLFRNFKAAGFSAPSLRNELPMGDTPEMRRYLFDLLVTLWPAAVKYDLPRDQVGDLTTLADRLDTELDACNSFASCLGVVNAFARRP